MPPKCRKVSRTRGRRSLDRISSLPDEILSYILSFLPTLMAVRTSVLSTRWRYIFTMTTNLYFDDGEDYYSHDDETYENGFERFVNGTLALHRVTSIQNFSLKIRRKCEYDFLYIREWITAAILKRVKHLHLFITYQDIYLPDCIFSSQTLVSLEINIVYYDLDVEVPSIVCLPNLRFLKFNNAVFSDAESSTRFFAGCSQLKELVLSRCDLGTDCVRISALALEKLTVYYCGGIVEIDAPNLVSLSYFFSSSGENHEDMAVLLKEPCSPSRVEVDFSRNNFSPYLPQFVLRLGTIASTARQLILSGITLKLLTRVDESVIPAYSNLKILQLGYVQYDTWNYLAFWLTNSPQLKTVYFVQGLHSCNRDCDIHDYHLPPDLVPFSSTVETIKVFEFEGSRSEMIIVKYLLENARSLKRLILCKATKTDLIWNIEAELRLCKELLMLPKASMYCFIKLI